MALSYNSHEVIPLGLVDAIKQGVDRLTGEAARQEAERQAVADREKQAKADKELLAKIALKDRFDNPIDRVGLQKDRQQEPGPAERAFPEHADRIKEAVARALDPAKEPQKTQEATRMELKPAGLQQAPSMNMGGVTWVNSRVQPPQAEQVQVQEPAQPKQETLIEMLERQRREKGQETLREAGMQLQQQRGRDDDRER